MHGRFVQILILFCLFNSSLQSDNSCVDKVGDCASQLEYCPGKSLSGYEDWMISNCCESCSIFSAAPSLSPSLNPTSSTVELCADIICENGGACIEGTCQCINDFYGTFCEMPPVTCADLSKDCVQWKEYCPGGSLKGYEDWMTENCCSTCDLEDYMQYSAHSMHCRDNDACVDEVCYTCQERVDIHISEGRSEMDSEIQVSEEFPTECSCLSPTIYALDLEPPGWDDTEDRELPISQGAMIGILVAVILFCMCNCYALLYFSGCLDGGGDPDEHDFDTNDNHSRVPNKDMLKIVTSSEAIEKRSTAVLEEQWSSDEEEDKLKNTQATVAVTL